MDFIRLDLDWISFSYVCYTSNQVYLMILKYSKIVLPDIFVAAVQIYWH